MATKTIVVLVLLAWAAPAAAQQRPLDTQDPETIGAGRVLIEGGISGAHGVTYPLSGLKGNLWQLPVLGVNVGISSIADLQITGRSEEHTSELQSQSNLVCRLLL